MAVDHSDAAALRAALDGAYGVFYVTVVLHAEFEQGELTPLQAVTTHRMTSTTVILPSDPRLLRIVDHQSPSVTRRSPFELPDMLDIADSTLALRRK